MRPPEESQEGAEMTIEEGGRLSRSLVWKLQRRFFVERGLRAWGEGVVPHYISNHPFLARAYLRTALGFLRDCQASIDPVEPLYVIELGTGAGRLGYHFLRQARAFFSLPALRNVRIKYVMTELTLERVEELSRNPFLSALADEEVLDFACFDAEAPGDLRLLRSGAVLAPGAVRNPLIVVANYFFDSIPQDVFLLSGGELYEALVKLVSSREETDLEDPAILGRLRLDYRYAPVGSAACYEEPALERILQAYRGRLDDTHLSFPSAGLRCLEHFRTLSGGRLLLLSGDRGYVHEESLLSLGAPGISAHGSFSMSVNYHAIAQYFRDTGGVALHARRRQSSLRICAFGLGRAEEDWAETRLAFTEALDAQGPDDFYSIRRGMERSCETLAIGEVLALLRFSGWDAHVFLGVYPRLMALVPDLDEPARQDLVDAARNVWDMYLPIGEGRDLGFHLGLLFTAMDDPAEALRFFGHSLRLHGRDATTLYNIALCQLRLGKPDLALAAIEEALELAPGYAPARHLRIKLQSAAGL